LRVFILQRIGFLTLAEAFMQGDAPGKILPALFSPDWALPGLLLAIFQRRHGATESGKSPLYAFLLLLPVAVIATGIFLFGIALGDGPGGLRY